MLNLDKLQREYSLQYSSHFEQVIIVPLSEFSYYGVGHHIITFYHGSERKKVRVRCQLYFHRPFLTADVACHALYHYAMKALQAWYFYNNPNPRYEDEPWDPDPDFSQLYHNTAIQYGVTTERMLHFWKEVDAQMTALQLTLLPDENRYRDPGRRVH